MNRYTIIKDKHQGDICINNDKLSGFKVKPRNRIKHSGIKVDSLVVTNPEFIDQVLKKKTKKKLELYLQYIISIIDDDSDTDPNSVALALDDLQRYKGIIDYHYRQYLDEKYTKFLLKKIELLERELKKKLVHIQTINNKESIEFIRQRLQEAYKQNEQLEEKEEEKSRRGR